MEDKHLELLMVGEDHMNLAVVVLVLEDSLEVLGEWLAEVPAVEIAQELLG